MSAPALPRPALRGDLRGARRWLLLSGQVAGALLLAPFALLLLLPAMALGGLVRAVGLGLVDLEVLPRRRALEVDAEGVALAWSGAGGESEAALADGLDLLLDTARRCGAVRSVRTVQLRPSPEAPAPALPVLDGSLGARLAVQIDGLQVAYGTLLVNDGELELAIEVDARGDRAGHLAVELPADRWLPWTRVLLDLAPAWGFKVRTARLQLPGREGDAGSAAA